MHAVGFSVLVAYDQIWIHRFHFFSHKSQLTFACGLNLSLVAERDWLERKERFASLLHWLNFFLKPPRRCSRAELTICIDKHAGASGRCHTKNVADITGVTHVLALYI